MEEIVSCQLRACKAQTSKKKLSDDIKLLQTNPGTFETGNESMIIASY